MGLCNVHEPWTPMGLLLSTRRKEGRGTKVCHATEELHRWPSLQPGRAGWWQWVRRPWKCPRWVVTAHFPCSQAAMGNCCASHPTHLTPAQPHSPMANVFSNSCMRTGEGKRLGSEFNSFPSWKGGWGRRGSAGLRSVGKAPVLHGWGWQLVHTSGSEGTGPQARQAPSYSSSSGAPALSFHKTGAVLSPVKLSLLPVLGTSKRSG